HRNVLVFRQFEFGRCDNSRAETHRLVFTELHIFDIGQRSNAQLLLLNRFMIALGDELLGQFVLNLLAKSLLNYGSRRFSWPVTPHFFQTPPTPNDLPPLLLHLLPCSL